MSRAGSGLLVLMSLVWATSAVALDAAEVRVRFPEGTTRGFLAIRTPQGDRIGHAELTQKPRGDEVDSRLLLQFKDGSVHDERSTYSQRGVFRLEAYRLTQRGPSFPGADVTFDRKSGRYQAKTREKAGAPEETASGEFEMPSNLANGLTLLLLKNMPRGERVTAQLVAFTPKPRLLRMTLQQEARIASCSPVTRSRPPGISSTSRSEASPAWWPPSSARTRPTSATGWPWGTFPRSSASRAPCS